MDILDYLVVAFLIWMAFRLGQASILTILKEDIRRRIVTGELDVKQHVREILEIPKEECHFDVERFDGHYYAYAVDGEFLAQGQDFRTMFQTIKQRFPNRSFRINSFETKLSEEEQRHMVTAILDTFGAQNEKSR